MTIRLRFLPRFPARISGAVGITVVREGVDLVVKPDYGALTQVPAVIDPETTFLQVWNETDDSYARLSFDDVRDAVAENGLMLESVYDPTGVAADAFDRANHTGAQAISTVTGLQTALDAKAPLASPAFTGNPTAPTPAAADNDTSIATTAFVQGEIASKAPLASPAFTGNPTAPTPSPGDNDTSLATTAFVTAAVAAGGTGFNLASSVATTSGTSVDFTGIPSNAKRVTLNLYGISTSGTSDLLVQGGTSGGVENSGYGGDVARFGASSLVTAQATAGLNLTGGDVGAADLYYGKVVFEKVSGNLWTIESKLARGNSTGMASAMTGKTFAADLDRIRLTTVGGANTFDAGTASISWET